MKTTYLYQHSNELSGFQWSSGPQLLRVLRFYAGLMTVVLHIVLCVKLVTACDRQEFERSQGGLFVP